MSLQNYFYFLGVNHFSRIMTNDSAYIKYEISTLAGFCLTIGYSSCVMLWKPSGAMVSLPDQFRYSSLDTHSQNRTFRASLLTANKLARNFVLFMNGRPLRPADLSNFYASMKFVQIWHDAWTVTQTPQAPFMFFLIIHYFERPASSVRLVKSIHLRVLPQYWLIHEL